MIELTIQQRVNRIMDDLDKLKMELPADSTLIVNISERLHALFITIARKLTQEEQEKQFNYEKQINQLKPFKTIRKNEIGLSCQPRTIRVEKIFNEYKKLVEKREIDLNELLEQLETKRKVQ